MGKFTRRTALLGVGALAGWGAFGWLKPNLPVYSGTNRLTQITGDTILNDASGLSATPIYKHIILTGNSGDQFVEQVRSELKAAETNGLSVNLGAARHSMGGQAIPRNGTAITFDNSDLEIDSSEEIFRVHAGARWSQIIAALDPAGWSPKVMQSNNDFGVAATFSVNAHGWPVPFGPMGSTVRSMRMVLPNGELISCSPQKNTDLFNHCMGGYGLMGIIIDMDVEMVRNSRLEPRFEQMEARNSSSAFNQVVNNSSVTMAYGRLNVERENFFSKALLVTYRETEDQTNLPAASGSGWMSHVASRLYRTQLGNETFKSFRWWNETVTGPMFGSGTATRNSLMNEPVITLDDRNPDRTDILHEYFVGFDRFDEFLSICREVIPASYQEFLNVTLRYVARDNQSTLSYAPVPRIAAVMSFSQELTVRAEADMKRMTRELISRITEIGGSYYLPYRPHATVGQFANTYVNASAFAKAKRVLDPSLLLRNNLWDNYLGKL